MNLFESKSCTIRIEKAISEKKNVEYFKLVIVIDGREYISFDNNLIQKILLDYLLKSK